MAPGGRFRRRARTLVAGLAVALSVLPLMGAAPADARGRSGGIDLTAGENGSGMPAIPVVYPDGTRSVSRAAVIFSDLDANDTWALKAIDYVAATKDWMRDFAPKPDGTYPFRPDATETRKYFARSVVRAFAPKELPDPSIVFADIDPSTAWYRFAAVAVAHGWMTRTSDGAFLPDKAVTMATVHKALVLALGLKPAATALDAIHTHTGVTFDLPPNFGTTLLGMRLGLRYNAPTGSEANDVAPSDRMPRSQVAYSLFRAMTQPSWSVPDLLAQYRDVELPYLGPRQRDIVQWGVRFVGYPYVWGGEWGRESPEPAALGGQPRSGFDCSGFAWWLLRHDDGGAWNVAPPRPYAGWSLPQRTSHDMATMAPTKLSYHELRPGDLMFYDGDRDGTVDHVDTYIGNGYSLDSSSTPGGITVMWVGDGWYRDHFVFGRRILA